MNSRPLSAVESENLACLNRAGLTSTLLFLTETGLRKGILDATEPMRAMFREGGVHNYDLQAQGETGKRVLESAIHTEEGIKLIAVSLYRPLTKNGDPRLWFSRFREYASADHVCAVFVHNQRIHVLNLTRSPLGLHFAVSNPTELSRFFDDLSRANSAVAADLLGKLKVLASNGPIEAVCGGDTAVGRSVEAALGIAINSSRQPDFHGIELKSGRAAIAGRANRATLFACVPDWSLSRCKSSKAILEEFGYARAGEFKLYCTISTQGINSQGLIFEFDDKERWLHERFARTPSREVAVWRLNTLEQCLATKHRETFWIEVESVRRRDREFFHLKSVLHTRNPNLPQFERMLRSGAVTMDHLIKQTASGGAQEKGPLFKIARSQIKELFLGEPAVYELR